MPALSPDIQLVPERPKRGGRGRGRGRPTKSGPSLHGTRRPTLGEVPIAADPTQNRIAPAMVLAPRELHIANWMGAATSMEELMKQTSVPHNIEGVSAPSVDGGAWAQPMCDTKALVAAWLCGTHVPGKVDEGLVRVLDFFDARRSACCVVGERARAGDAREPETASHIDVSMRSSVGHADQGPNQPDRKALVRPPAQGVSGA